MSAAVYGNLSLAIQLAFKAWPAAWVQHAANGHSKEQRPDSAGSGRTPPGGAANVIFGDDYQLDPHRFSPAQKGDANKPAPPRPRRPPGGATSNDFPF